MSVKNIAQGIARQTKLIIVKGKGSYVYTYTGAKYLDFTSGISVTNTGNIILPKNK